MTTAFDQRLGAFIRAQRANTRRLRAAMADPAPSPAPRIPIAPCGGCTPAQRPPSCPGRCTPAPATH